MLPLGELLPSETAVLKSTPSSGIAVRLPPNVLIARLELGKISSTGFLSARFRFGDPLGLAGRCGDKLRCPAAFTPGIDDARAIGGAKALAVDLDLKCPREYGDVFRVWMGRVGEEKLGKLEKLGDGGEGAGSVALRGIGGR